MEVLSLNLLRRKVRLDLVEHQIASQSCWLDKLLSHHSSLEANKIINHLHFFTKLLRLFAYMKAPQFAKPCTLAPISSCSPLRRIKMASSPSLPFLLFFLGMLSFAELTLAARNAPAITGKEAPEKEDGRLRQEDTVQFPGFGGWGWFRDLDHSGPAAFDSQYLPGADDTFVPNPGFEVPNPFQGRIP